MTTTRWDANVADLQSESGMVNGEIALLAGYLAAGDGGGGLMCFSTTVPPSRQVTTASSGTPILITTAAAHGLVTGQRVIITGSSNTSANGTRSIRVILENNFQLIGSSAAGAGSGGIIGDGGSIPSSSTTIGIWNRMSSFSAPVGFSVVIDDVVLGTTAPSGLTPITFVQTTGTKTGALPNGSTIGQTKRIVQSVATGTPIGKITGTFKQLSGAAANTLALGTAVAMIADFVWDGSAWRLASTLGGTGRSL